MTTSPHITLVQTASGYNLATPMVAGSAVMAPLGQDHAVVYAAVPEPQYHPHHSVEDVYIDPAAAGVVLAVAGGVAGAAVLVRCRERFRFVT